MSADALAHAIATASQTAITAAAKAMAEWESSRKNKANADRLLKQRMKLLRWVPLFKTQPETTVEAIAKALEVRMFDAGQYIITQGVEGDPEGDDEACFLLEEGECYARVVQEDGRWDEVAEYEEGGFFGERAILRKEPQEATVSARTSVKALRLSAVAFTRVIRERDHR